MLLLSPIVDGIKAVSSVLKEFGNEIGVEEVVVGAIIELKNLLAGKVGFLIGRFFVWVCKEVRIDIFLKSLRELDFMPTFGGNGVFVEHIDVVSGDFAKEIKRNSAVFKSVSGEFGIDAIANVINIRGCGISRAP